MRHNIQGKKLNRTSSHRKAMFANMAVALITHEQIQTTLPKAKELRRYVEKLVTTSRKNTLQARKNLISKIKDELAVRKLIGVLGSRYSKRPGGYTRIIKSGFRYGDVAPIAYIEFVDRNTEAKGRLLLDQVLESNNNTSKSFSVNNSGEDTTNISKNSKASIKQKNLGVDDSKSLDSKSTEGIKIADTKEENNVKLPSKTEKNITYKVSE